MKYSDEFKLIILLTFLLVLLDECSTKSKNTIKSNGYSSEVNDSHSR